MTGIINWNEMWKAVHHNGFHHHGENPGAHWDQKAKEFNRRVMRHKERAQSQVAFLDLRPEETVLDVGAGTGRLAIPMAKIAKSVTALDQSSGMLACLKENMDAEGIANINIIHKSWQDVVPDEMPQHDVVISSNSLGVFDLEAALSKMNSIAKRAVCIFTFADRRRDDGFKEFLMPGHRRKALNRPPDYLMIVNLLADMGIYADVKIVTWEASEHYASIDEAVASWKEMREVPEDKEPQLREFLSQKLVPDNGGFTMNRRSKQARISWQKGQDVPA